jgi:hypothetical protein
VDDVHHVYPDDVVEVKPDYYDIDDIVPDGEVI